MIVIPHKKINSKGDTIQMLLADQDKFKKFRRDVRAYLKNTQHKCMKKGYSAAQNICVHSDYHDWPDSVPFRRFNHFCYKKGRGAKDVLEITRRYQYQCECEILWRHGLGSGGDISGKEEILDTLSCTVLNPHGITEVSRLY